MTEYAGFKVFMTVRAGGGNMGRGGDGDGGLSAVAHTVFEPTVAALPNTQAVICVWLLKQAEHGAQAKSEPPPPVALPETHVADVQLPAVHTLHAFRIVSLVALQAAAA